MASLINNDPSRYEDIQEAKAQLEHFTQTWQGNAARGGGGYVIPVVFHIIHNNGPENISDDQVRDGVRIMNEDYNKLNPDWPDVQPAFLGIVANIGITFKLAELDPNGNCTNGITRTVSTLTYNGDQDMKNLIDWPRDRYLNIWVSAGAGGAAGYSMYPSSVSGSWGAAADGIVVLSSYVGSIGTSDPSHGHTLSHEAGHWMNLKHPWGDSNNPGLASNCSIDDGVADTPNTEGWTTCVLDGATCGSVQDNVENFMDYSYCSKMFTEGQKTRMLAALNSSTAGRNNIWTDSNLALTGVLNDPVLCVAALHSDTRMICAGSSVNYTDDSYNGATQWNWSFPGGTPATSTDQNPTVSYATSGTYDVTLTAGNGTATVAVTDAQYVVVLPSTGMPLPYSEGFEDVSVLPSDSWTPIDIDQDGGFQVSDAAAYSGSRSVELLNNIDDAQKIDELIGNTIDASAVSSFVASFRYAFAKRSNADNDVLRLYVSKDCGESWSLRRVLNGSQLATALPQNGSFVPSGPAQWGYSETTPINEDFLSSDMRIKFWFQSDGGNNLWLDDININGEPVGIDEIAGADHGGLQVFPNPAGQFATLEADLMASGPVKVEILDMLGRSVRTIAEENKAAGAARWDLPLEGLNSGLYLVRVQQQGSVRIARFTKD
ncbi:MAG: M43 family zinc metalloprotease [Flavobacteriales bacterium]